MKNIISSVADSLAARRNAGAERAAIAQARTDRIIEAEILNLEETRPVEESLEIRKVLASRWVA